MRSQVFPLTAMALALLVPAGQPGRTSPRAPAHHPTSPTQGRGPDLEPEELVMALSGDDAVGRFGAEQQLIAKGDEALPALERLARAPGFAPAWEDVMAEAQSEADQIDNGLIGMVRKAFRPSLSVGSSKPALEAGEASEAEEDSAEQDDRGARSTSIG